jgi:hypothetical protein
MAGWRRWYIFSRRSAAAASWRHRRSGQWHQLAYQSWRRIMAGSIGGSSSVNGSGNGGGISVSWLHRQPKWRKCISPIRQHLGWPRLA